MQKSPLCIFFPLIPFNLQKIRANSSLSRLFAPFPTSIPTPSALIVPFLFFVQDYSGSVNVESNDLWGNKSILSHVEAGQAFAETYALCGEPLMVDVAAAEPCEILWLDLVPMMQQQNTAASWYPKFLHNLLLLSMQKNLALSQRIRCTTPKSARGRLLTYLSAQAVRAGSTHFSIPFDRQQLADYLNLDRSALSKELGKMRDDGLIRCRKNKFELCGTE